MKKILIVTCRFDEDRNGGSRPWRVPQAMAAAYLAGGFNPRLCEVRLYSELYSGPLVDLDLLRWPDMLVLSGLQVDFDRFLHLTAYARTLNPKVIVVAGGSLVEVLPVFSRKFFDYCCCGPVEDIQNVIRDTFGPDHVSEAFMPRWVFEAVQALARLARVCSECGEQCDTVVAEISKQEANVC